MHLILCHNTADFDTLGAAVGLSRLFPGATIVLSGDEHPSLNKFLAQYPDQYPIATAGSIDPHQIQTLRIVNTQHREHLGHCSAWLDLPQLTAIEVYDHHSDNLGNIPATKIQLAAVGATTTLIAELLQQQKITLTIAEATVMALGIHGNAGSLTFNNTTTRDAKALAWLIAQDAQLAVIAEHREQRPAPALHQPFSLLNTPTDLSQRLLPELWTVLTAAAQLAQTRGWQLYIVGGAVRDLLLATDRSPLLLPDLDLVVDGFDNSAEDRAGVELAQSLHQLYPTARIDIHGEFQTAALLWHQDPILGSLAIDIATARTEVYPYPAANPQVEASSIQQDLYRRDFTINALAICLTSPQAGSLLDFFGGLLDLQQQQLRVLHPLSFIEDPTRIFRGVRFAVRLGFRFESQTNEYVRYAIDSGVYQRTLSQNTKVPALQTRLRTELKYILQSDYWLTALEQLHDLDALQCLHPHLKLDDNLRHRLQIGQEYLQSPALTHLRPHLTPWLLRLEILLTALLPAERVQVAQQLQLPSENQEYLSQLDAADLAISPPMAEDLSIGQMVTIFQAYQPHLLLLLAITTPTVVRNKIYQYLTNWSLVKAPITGNDLKALGYAPGTQYKQILAEVLSATLNGHIDNRLAAIAYVQEHYPI